MCSVCAAVLRFNRCGGVGRQILLYLVIHQYRIELVGKIGVPMVIILVIIQELLFRGGRNESRSNRKWDRKSCRYSQLVQVWVAASHNPAKKSLGLLRNNMQHMHLTIVDTYKFTILQWAKLMMSNFLNGILAWKVSIKLTNQVILCHAMSQKEYHTSTYLLTSSKLANQTRRWQCYYY